MDKQHIVVTYHGLGLNSLSMRLINNHLRKNGFTVVSVDYPSRQQSISDNVAKIIIPQIQAYLDDQNVTVHHVGYSLGGVMVFELLNQLSPNNTGRVLTLASPHYGSLLACYVSRFNVGRKFFGPVLEELRAQESSYVNQLVKPTDYEIGVITGNKPFLFGATKPWMDSDTAHDGLVSEKSALIAQAQDRLIVDVTHASILWRRDIRRQIVHFLQNGVFAK